jgi:very-short-patch-repair endonuclease
VTVSANRRVRSTPTVRVARTRRSQRDVVTRSGVRLTAVRRTVVDLLVDASLVTAVAAADAACHADAFLLPRLDEDLRFLRRPGVRRARHRLALVEPSTESPLETLLRLLLVTAGLPRPRAQVTVTEAGQFLARVDFLLPGRLVVETDGRQHHESWAAGIADRQRQNRLVAAGYRVLRSTWHDVTTRPAEVVAELRAALAHPSHHHTVDPHSRSRRQIS